MFRGAIVFASGMTVGFAVGLAVGGGVGGFVGYCLGLEDAEDSRRRPTDIIYRTGQTEQDVEPKDAEEVPVTENQDQGESNDGE
jgi:hypothetical protein